MPPADLGLPLGAMGGGGAALLGTGLVVLPVEGEEERGLDVVVSVWFVVQTGTNFVLRLTEDCKIGAEISRPLKLLLVEGAAELPP